MLAEKKWHFFKLVCGAGFLIAALMAFFRPAPAKGRSSSEPWTAAQVVEPAALAKEIAGANAENKPIVVCVGMRTYFKNAHVPGAVLHGPAMSQAGLDDLKKWADGLPRSANLVVYCGCCPLAGCPNLRPGFLALRHMGFSHLRVLPFLNSFATDWVEKGFPVEKGD
jgi:thiosulfate/3-mercaptopyruvate sulfurtransferase